MSCLIGINGTIGSLYGAYREIQKAQEGDTGIAPMVTNDGTLVYVNVKVPENWRKIAGYVGLGAAEGYITAQECRYSLFAGHAITYWCGSEHLLRRTDGQPMYADQYDFFFREYRCFNGWAYYGDNWWADPYYSCRVNPGWCIRYDDNG